MRMLVLSFHYSPDLSAGAFRAKALVDAFHALLPPGSHIDVITSLPNRYRSFSPDAPRREERPGLSIHRIALPPHRSGECVSTCTLVDRLVCSPISSSPVASSRTFSPM